MYQFEVTKPYNFANDTFILRILLGKELASRPKKFQKKKWISQSVCVHKKFIRSLLVRIPFSQIFLLFCLILFVQTATYFPSLGSIKQWIKEIFAVLKKLAALNFCTKDKKCAWNKKEHLYAPAYIWWEYILNVDCTWIWHQRLITEQDWEQKHQICIAYISGMHKAEFHLKSILLHFQSINVRTLI